MIVHAENINSNKELILLALLRFFECKVNVRIRLRNALNRKSYQIDHRK